MVQAMKNLLIITIIPFFMGCAALDKLVLSDPTPAVNDAGQTIDPPPTVKQGIKAAVELAGDVVPVPWAGLAANGLLLALTSYGSFRGKRWKKAATSAIQAGNEFRQVAKQVAPDRYQEVKSRITGMQNADGTRKLIKVILNQVT